MRWIAITLEAEKNIMPSAKVCEPSLSFTSNTDFFMRFEEAGPSRILGNLKPCDYTVLTPIQSYRQLKGVPDFVRRPWKTRLENESNPLSTCPP